MIPGRFEYHRPQNLAEAAGLLGRLGPEASVLAGGHSLIPMMKLRMAVPEHLVDLQDVGELKGITIGADAIVIGAMTTQHELIADDALAEAAPILREAALQISDPQVRYVGTVGGNVANGDPGNDMPGLMQCLGAAYELVSDGGTRTVAAREFYRGAYDTAREDGEILRRIVIPPPAAGSGYAYEKLKRKIGDYATAAAAVMVARADGRCTAASIALTNLSDRPVWAEAAGDALVGGSLDAESRDKAVAAALALIEPADDNRGPADFKHYVAGVILGRAIERAAERAA